MFFIDINKAQLSYFKNCTFITVCTKLNVIIVLPVIYTTMNTACENRDLTAVVQHTPESDC